MPEEKIQSGFSKEYTSTDKTETTPTKPTIPKPVDFEKYGIGKPKRTVIRAKISYDKHP